MNQSFDATFNTTIVDPPPPGGPQPGGLPDPRSSIGDALVDFFERIVGNVWNKIRQIILVILEDPNSSEMLKDIWEASGGATKDRNGDIHCGDCGKYMSLEAGCSDCQTSGAWYPRHTPESVAWQQTREAVGAVVDRGVIPKIENADIWRAFMEQIGQPIVSPNALWSTPDGRIIMAFPDGTAGYVDSWDTFEKARERAYQRVQRNLDAKHRRETADEVGIPCPEEPLPSSEPWMVPFPVRVFWPGLGHRGAPDTRTVRIVDRERKKTDPSYEGEDVPLSEFRRRYGVYEVSIPGFGDEEDTVWFPRTIVGENGECQPAYCHYLHGMFPRALEFLRRRAEAQGTDLAWSEVTTEVTEGGRRLCRYCREEVNPVNGCAPCCVLHEGPPYYTLRSALQEVRNRYLEQEPADGVLPRCPTLEEIEREVFAILGQPRIPVMMIPRSDSSWVIVYDNGFAEGVKSSGRNAGGPRSWWEKRNGSCDARPCPTRVVRLRPGMLRLLSTINGRSEPISTMDVTDKEFVDDVRGTRHGEDLPWIRRV